MSAPVPVAPGVGGSRDRNDQALGRISRFVAPKQEMGQSCFFSFSRPHLALHVGVTLNQGAPSQTDDFMGCFLRCPFYQRGRLQESSPPQKTRGMRCVSWVHGLFPAVDHRRSGKPGCAPWAPCACCVTTRARTPGTPPSRSDQFSRITSGLAFSAHGCTDARMHGCRRSWGPCKPIKEAVTQSAV